MSTLSWDDTFVANRCNDLWVHTYHYHEVDDVMLASTSLGSKMLPCCIHFNFMI